MKQKLISKSMHLYHTCFQDVRSSDQSYVFAHDAIDLPHAIKDGRARVRDLNHEFGRKVYYFVKTYRCR